MQLDVSLPIDVPDPGDAAAAAERRGYGAGWVGETKYDALISLSAAAARTTRLHLGTGIAVAFARSPMTTAVAANQVQLLTQGRLLLGLGSQVGAHITRRFSMPWSAPAARMREFILALRTIWAAWADGGPLDFRGEFYTHTLMTPFFDPGPNPYGAPQVWLAAVGELMTAVAGEVADGLLCHGFTTERYLREVTIPALHRGAASADRPAGAVALSVAPFVVTGRDEAEFAQAAAAVRQQIAFYGSTPSYRPVLELHGWGELQTELRTMSKQGRWREMGELIDDDVLAAFAVVGEPHQLAPMLLARFGDIADRMCLYVPGDNMAPVEPALDALLAASTP